MRFDWDPAKERVNRAKHGLSFEEASTLFVSGQDYLVIFDEAHSTLEERFISIGMIHRGVVVVVWVEPREDVVRIISARLATRRETRLFQRHIAGEK